MSNIYIDYMTFHDEFHASTNDGSFGNHCLRLKNDIDFTAPYEYLEEVSKNDTTSMEVYDAVGLFLAKKTYIIPQGSGLKEDEVHLAS